MLLITVVVALIGLVSAQQYAGVTVIKTSASTPECSKIYSVYLQEKYTAQGNDTGMLPPMGKDTSAFGGFNYIGYPFPKDTVKQANAAAQNSVTALTESTGHFTELNDAYPLGFQTDVLDFEYSVCVYVRNVYNRWVEIMAEAADRTMCVTDWQKPNTAGNPSLTSCGTSRLYSCRESGNAINKDGSYADTMAVRFYCTGQGCESSDFKFRWRIMASNIQRSNVGALPDQEYFCHMRSGSDYPQSLLQPYPVSYKMPSVFEQATGSPASRTTISLVTIILVCLAVAVAILF